MIAYFGMGMLGSNFVKAMLKNGEQVNVWNRTAAKAKALEAFGAKAFDNIPDALVGVTRLHLTLKDDESVDEILHIAEPHLEKGCVIFDHTTTTAAGAAVRTEYWKSKGHTYLHTPVFMGPQNALDSTGTMLLSGDADVMAMAEPLLKPMTGKLLFFGPKNNTAAGMKLIGNLFLIAMTAGVADSLALATGFGIEPAMVTELFASWNPAGMLPMRINKMTSGTFDQPTWELDMARKDARLMMQEADASGKQLIAIPAIAAAMDTLIAQGLGQNDWTVIGKQAVS